MRTICALGLLLLLTSCGCRRGNNEAGSVSMQTGPKDIDLKDRANEFTVWRCYRKEFYRVEEKTVCEALVALDNKGLFSASMLEGPIILWLEENGKVSRALVLHPKSKPPNGVELLPVIIRDGLPEADWSERILSREDLSVEMYDIEEYRFRKLIDVAMRALKGDAMDADKWLRELDDD